MSGDFVDKKLHPIKKYGKISRSILHRSVTDSIGFNEFTATEIAVGTGEIEMAILRAYNKAYVYAISFSDPEDTLRVPEYISNSIILPYECDEEVLKDIVNRIEAKTDELDLLIVGGHTEVSKAVNEPVITFTVCGNFPAELDYDLENLCLTEDEIVNMTELDVILPSTKDIVVSAYIGIEGTAILYNEHKDEIKEKLSENICQNLEKFKDWVSVKEQAEAAFAVDQDGDDLYYVSGMGTGGIYESLTDIAEYSGYNGFCVDIKKIPIRQETVEVCNLFDVNPYMMPSSGALVIVTSDANKVIAKFEAAGIPAGVIGQMTLAAKQKVVTIDDEVKSIEPFKFDILKNKN